MNSHRRTRSAGSVTFLWFFSSSQRVPLIMLVTIAGGSPVRPSGLCKAVGPVDAHPIDDLAAVPRDDVEEIIDEGRVGDTVRGPLRRTPYFCLSPPLRAAHYPTGPRRVKNAQRSSAAVLLEGDGLGLIVAVYRDDATGGGRIAGSSTRGGARVENAKFPCMELRRLDFTHTNLRRATFC